MSGESRIGRCTTQAIGAALALLATLVVVSCAPSTDAVSSATPSPETYATPYYGQVYVREAIIRESPDIGSSEVTRLPQGTSVSVLARQGEWVQVEGASGSGWVYAELLNISVSPPTLTPTATPPSTPTPTPCPTVCPSPSPTSTSEGPSASSPTPATAQPSPTAPPTLTPTPSYPPIVLVEPADGVTIKEHTGLRWQWAGSLDEKHCFLIRFQHVDNPAVSGFCLSRETEHHLELWKWPKGLYTWFVALASGCDAQTLENNTILLQSEKRMFIQVFLPPPTPPPTPAPTASPPAPPPRQRHLIHSQ